MSRRGVARSSWRAVAATRGEGVVSWSMGSGPPERALVVGEATVIV